MGDRYASTRCQYRTNATDCAGAPDTDASVMKQPDLQALWQQAVDHFER